MSIGRYRYVPVHVDSTYIRDSIFHNGHTEAASRCSEPSFSYTHYSHSLTLQVEMSKAVAPKQALQVSQAAAAAAPVEAGTCGWMNVMGALVT